MAHTRHVESFLISGPALTRTLSLIGAIPADGRILTATLDARVDELIVTVEYAGARELPEGSTPPVGLAIDSHSLAERFEEAAKRIRLEEKVEIAERAAKVAREDLAALGRVRRCAE